MKPTLRKSVMITGRRDGDGRAEAVISNIDTMRCDRCGEMPATNTVQAFLNDMPDSDKMYLCPECVESYKENSAYWVIESI